MYASVDDVVKPEKTTREDGWPEMSSEAIRAACLANSPRDVPLRHPIFRRIYLVFFVFISLFFLMPFWCIIYLPRCNRPRNSWSLQRCLRVRWSRRLCGVVARCEVDYLGRNLDINMDPLTLQHSHPVTIPPAPASYLRGHPAETLSQLHESRGNWLPHFVHRMYPTNPGVWGRWNAEHEKEKVYGFEKVTGFWFTGKKVNPEDGPRHRHPGQAVMLHFHGGGYLCGTAAETDLTSQIPKHLVVHSPIHHVLSIDYRLAPNAPWPLPLLDAISSYHYLVHVEKIPEKDIVIAGDSAGGHLAIALTRWIRDEGGELGLKGARGLVVMSPWTDIGFTNQWGEEAFKFNAESDTVENTFGPFATSLLLRALPPTIMHTSPYLSPSSLLIPTPSSGPASLENYPPTFVVYGEAERLANEIKVFWSRLQVSRKISTPHTTMDKIVMGPDAVHDFMIFPWMAEEAAVVYETLDEWLRDLLSEDVDEEEVEVSEAMEEPTSPEMVNFGDKWKGLKRRTSRRLERRSLKIGKSPVMGPVRDDRRGVMRLVGDLKKEGMSMIDLPPLDLDLELPLESAKEWFTPFTTQYERSEWDWSTRSPLLSRSEHPTPTKSQQRHPQHNQYQEDEHLEDEEGGNDWYEIAGSDTSDSEEDGGMVGIDEIEGIGSQMGYGDESRKDV